AGRETISSGRSHRARFRYVGERNVEVRTITENVFDLVRLIAQRKCYVLDAGLSKYLYLEQQERAVQHGNYRFWSINSKRAQPRSFATRKNQCFHTNIISFFCC